MPFYSPVRMEEWPNVLHALTHRLSALLSGQAALHICMAFAILAVTFLTGCAAYEPRMPVVSVIENRQHNVVMQQWDLSCAAAALATILTYQHGFPLSESQIAQAMLQKTDPLRVKVRGGFSLLDLKRYAQSQSFVAEGYRDLSLDELDELGPAIVPLETASDAHFVVFRGVANNKVLLADPNFGNVAMDIPTFEKSWQQRIGFVVTRQDDQPPPNRLTVRDGDFMAVPDAALQRALR